MQDTSEIGGALEALEQKIAAAWVNGDRQFIDSILADDWSVIDLSGSLLTKEQVISGAFKGEERTVLSMDITNVTSKVFDGWAIVTGKTRASGEYQGNVMEVQLRFTDVFVERDGRWQVVASQATRLQAE